MPVWAAEIEVDERLVRGLLAQLGLEGARLRKLAEGWDNSVWVVDERYAFRFPRRAVAIPLLERELAAAAEAGAAAAAADPAAGLRRRARPTATRGRSSAPS